MNTYQKEMYQDLMRLCSEVETFYFKDRELDGVTYRVFSYYMGSYTEFCMPSALECRGSMFRMEGDDPVELASLPFPKFFNIYENPMVMNPDFNSVVRFEEKADGSLISTFLHNGRVRVKSKTSLDSIMANDANDYLNDKNNRRLRNALQYFAEHGMTVLMEWCDPKPESRIVLSYDRPHLRVFGMRDTASGEIIDYWDDKELCARLGDEERTFDHSLALVRESVEHHYTDDAEGYAAATPAQTGIEGYIMVMEDGSRMKIKTDWYVTQHRLKDSVTNTAALFVSAIKGSTDDLKSIFHDNSGAMKLIEEMEEYAFSRYKMFKKEVETFYEENKNLERKDYAIKAKAEPINTIQGD